MSSNRSKNAKRVRKVPALFNPSSDYIAEETAVYMARGGVIHRLAAIATMESVQAETNWYLRGLRVSKLE